MNKFNKMILMGLLSIAVVATNVKGSTTPLEDPTAQLEITQIGDKDSKFFVMANPKLGSAVPDQAGIDAVVNASIKNAKHVTKFIDVTNSLTVKNVSEELDKVTSKDVVCAKVLTKTDITKYAQFNDSEKSNIAILYACWMIKANNATCLDAIKKIKADFNLTSLSKEQINLIELYFIKQNLVEKALPGHSGKIAFALGIGTGIILAAAVVAELNWYYDNHCTNSPDTGLCTAASHANALVALLAGSTAFAEGLGTKAKKWFSKKTALTNVDTTTSKVTPEKQKSINPGTALAPYVRQNPITKSKRSAGVCVINQYTTGVDWPKYFASLSSADQQALKNIDLNDFVSQQPASKIPAPLTGLKSNSPVENATNSSQVNSTVADQLAKISRNKFIGSVLAYSLAAASLPILGYLSRFI